MANETTYSALADSRATEILIGTWQSLLAERGPLPTHPAILKAPDVAGLGSSKVRVSAAALDGYTLLASTSDGSPVSNTTLVDEKYEVTVARYSKTYAPTDLALLTDPGQGLNFQRFATDAFISAQQTLVNLVAALSAGFSTVVGTSGSNLTLANFLEAKATLEIANAADAGLIAILHPRQWNDLVQDAALTITGGAGQYDPANNDVTKITGGSYKGRVHGVDVYVSSRVPTANSSADRAGMMLGRNAIVYAEGSAPVLDPVNQMAIGPVLFERSRNAQSGLWNWTTHYYVGVAEMFDAAGVGIVTDA